MHVASELDGRIAAVLDGGPCRVGVESTVLDLSAERAAVAAPGRRRARRRLEPLIGAIAAPSPDDAPRAPGMLASHYAPSLPLRLDATSVGAGEALLAFGPDGRRLPPRSSWLSPSGDLAEAAANLFAMLRALDRPEFHRHRRHADPRARPRPRHQRPAAPRRRAQTAGWNLPGGCAED